MTPAAGVGAAVTGRATGAGRATAGPWGGGPATRTALLLWALALPAAPSVRAQGDPLPGEATLCAAPTALDDPAVVAAGERLYLEGLTRSGAPLRGGRAEGAVIEGQDAACAGCHRHSGLGSFEGAIRVPPIAWRLLSRSGAEIAADRTLPHVAGFRPQRPAYTPATLLRALRAGVASDGRPLSWVMPRYPGLDAADFTALCAALQARAASAPAGSQDGQLRFALVATPQAEPTRVAAVAAVFERAFADHNAALGPGAGDSSAYAIPRRLHLTVWQLHGPAAAWPEQLDRLRAQEPVFALLGGLGGGDWGVIDRWSEARRLPELLASADAPETHEGFYAVHFQRGVALEAALIAADLRTRQPAGGRVLQWFRREDSGALGAAALRAELGPAWQVEDRPLDAVPAAAPAAGTNGVAAVLWLRPQEFGLPGPLTDAPAIYLSGLMAGEQPALPNAWLGHLRMTYPYELPQRRRVAMNRPLGWLRAQGLPVVDLRLQSEAWLASQVLDAALADMVDAYYPDYLVERVESLLGHRLENALYPRLSLAPGQRFASKGGYLVRVAADGSLSAEGGWTIP